MGTVESRGFWNPLGSPVGFLLRASGWTYCSCQLRTFSGMLVPDAVTKYVIFYVENSMNPSLSMSLRAKSFLVVSQIENVWQQSAHNTGICTPRDIVLQIFSYRDEERRSAQSTAIFTMICSKLGSPVCRTLLYEKLARINVKRSNQSCCL